MKLSKNFSLHEFLRSDTAKQLEIDNTPNKSIIINLRRLASQLQKLRDSVDAKISISSGYRCEELNRAIGGSRRSKHMQGLAADFTIQGYSVEESINIIKDNCDFDIVINEYDKWVHLALSNQSHRNLHLLATRKNGKVNYELV